MSNEYEENEEKIRRLILISAIISIVLIAGILIFFLASKLLTPPPSIADFRLELNRTRVEVVKGKTVNVLITLVPEGSFYGDVLLEIKSPENMSSIVSKSILNPSSNTAVLTLDTLNIAPGSYYVEISGSYLEINRKTVLIVSVKEAEKPFFKANANVYPKSIIQMESFFINVSIIPQSGFNDDISIAIENLPGCWIEEKVINRGINSSKITVYTNRSIPVGVNNFSLVLSSPSYLVSIPLTITVLEAPPPSFRISFYPNITIVKPGDIVNIRVRVEPFYGFNELIRVYSSHISVELEKFNGSSFVLTTRNYSGVIISMKVSRNAKCNIYRLTFFANSSIGRREIMVSLGVVNVSYRFSNSIPGLVVSPAVIEATPGQDVQLDVLIGSINGFEGEVIPRVSQLTVGTYSFFTGEGYQKIGLPVDRVSIKAGEAKFIHLCITLNRNTHEGTYRFKVELCIERQFLEPVSTYTVVLRVS